MGKERAYDHYQVPQPAPNWLKSGSEPVWLDPSTMSVKYFQEERVKGVKYLERGFCGKLRDMFDQHYPPPSHKLHYNLYTRSTMMMMMKRRKKENIGATKNNWGPES